jgi:hypothetical protein
MRRAAKHRPKNTEQESREKNLPADKEGRAQK